MDRNDIREAVILSLLLSILSSFVALFIAFEGNRLDDIDGEKKAENDKKLRTELDQMHREIALLKKHNKA